jgi:hypothetical protein
MNEKGSLPQCEWSMGKDKLSCLIGRGYQRA